MSDESVEITKLLHQWRAGNIEAEGQLFQIVMPNLRRLAHYLMKTEREDHPLQATELVSEAYFRLVAAKDRDWQSRKHFFAIAVRVMRRQLIDIGRGPKPPFVPIEAGHNLLPEPHPFSPEEWTSLNRCLDKLAREKSDWCTVVEMKFILGFSDAEAAEEMGVPLRTLQRMWRDARKRLHACMETGNAPSAGR
jgi:RNA polymerase sigma factor (TIGR02999 family)